MKKIEFIYGHNPQEIYIRTLRYKDDEEVTVARVIEDSKVKEIFPLKFEDLSYAIFKEAVEADHLVADGDRVSLLRPRIRTKQRAPRENAEGRRR